MYLKRVPGVRIPPSPDFCVGCNIYFIKVWSSLQVCSKSAVLSINMLKKNFDEQSFCSKSCQNFGKRLSYFV